MKATWTVVLVLISTAFLGALSNGNPLHCRAKSDDGVVIWHEQCLKDEMNERISGLNLEGCFTENWKLTGPDGSTSHRYHLSSATKEQAIANAAAINNHPRYTGPRFSYVYMKLDVSKIYSFFKFALVYYCSSR